MQRLYKLDVKLLLLIGIIFPVLFDVFVVYLESVFPNVFFNVDNYDPIELIKEKTYLLFSILLISPFIETAIQYVPVKLSIVCFSKYRYSSIISIIISAIFFACLHRSGLIYFVTLSFAGFIWASICFLLIKRDSHAYLYTTLIHAFYNLSILALDYYVYS